MKLRLATGILTGLVAYLVAVIFGLAYRLPLGSVLIKGLKSLLVFAICGVIITYVIEKAASTNEEKESAGEAEGDDNENGNTETANKPADNDSVETKRGGDEDQLEENKDFRPLDLPILEVEGEE